MECAKRVFKYNNLFSNKLGGSDALAKPKYFIGLLTN